MTLTNIRDLMTAEDAMEMEERYEAVLRERNEYEEELGESFREAERSALLDWEVDLPDLFQE